MKIKSLTQAAFVRLRLPIALVLVFAGVALGFFAFHNASAQNNARTPVVQAANRGLAPVVRFDVSPPLRSMKIIEPTSFKMRENEDRDIVPLRIRFAPEWDPVVQTTQRQGIEIPGPIQSFNGPPNLCGGCAPPDPNGEVGLNHVVVMDNVHFQVFNKSGTSLFGPAANNTLWSGFGGPCQTENAGDPVVLYDQVADRWFLSQFTSAGPNFFFCVAVSQTPDPAGAYFRYAISTGTNFPDYPKAAVWPDAYYVSTREFTGGSGGPFAGVGAYALNRAQAIAGNPSAQVISLLAPPTPAYAVGDGLLPSDWDGTSAPPAGSPNFFIGSQDNNGPYGAPADALNIWKFHADFAVPANSTMILTNTLATAPFNSILGLCGGTRSCIPQPGTTNRLDHQGYRQRPLFRAAYRNFGDHEALVTNQSVSGGTGPNGEVSGIRWWELRGLNTAPVIFQEGTYAPGVTDGVHRWFGSIALNGAGSMGLGFSAANNTNPAVFPSVRYTGRTAGDPAGQMPQGEGTIINGTGSQTGGGNRWGDYTDMTVDPVDDSTFWYVSEWIPTTSAAGWQLRIGSFKVAVVPENSIVSGGYAIISAGPNGMLDPGEVVTVALGIKDINVGAPGTICTTAALTGTLQATGGVTSPSGPQNYGALCTGGPVVFRNFTFTVDPALPCGSTVTASLAITDGAINFGTIPYLFTTGSTISTNIENFDGVVAPALPAGWTTTFSGSGTAVATSTTDPDTAPNDIFFSEGTTVGLSEVTSATIAVANASAKLSFRNLFNTESTFDGLVLEISIAGGAFQDILAAGGTFASGGYNSTLSTGFNNPLPGRQAWSGLSGGTAAAPTYITSVVNLPAAATGQNIQLRWRQGSDSSVAPTNPGSRVDSLKFSQLICGGNAPVVNSAVSRKTHTGVGVFDVPLPMVALTGAIGIEDRTGAVAGAHQVVVTFASPVTVSAVSLTTGVGAATFAVAGAVVTIDLTGVADVQRLGISLSGVSDGSNLGTVLIPMGVLQGDTSGNAQVTATDVGQTKAATAGGGTVNASTFRTDVNANGTINSTDIAIVKGRSGTTLP